MIRNFRSLAALTFLSLILLACDAKTLIPLSKTYDTSIRYAKIEARVCTLPAKPAIHKSKTVFIIDHSSSNKPTFTNPNPVDVNSTDPSGGRRYGPLVQFVQQPPADPNNLPYYSLIDFSDTAYTPGFQGTLVGGSPMTANPFTNDLQKFLNTDVIPDWIGPNGTPSAPAPIDQGFTNYVDAIDSALQLIRSDAFLEAGNPIRPIVTTNYDIIFVSDGLPVVPGGGALGVIEQTTAQILPIVKNIVDLKNDPNLSPYISQIRFNTAYYTVSQQGLTAAQLATVARASALLQQMAATGNGQFVQFGAGQSVLYQSLAPPAINPKTQIADVFVENKNAVWWDDGRLLSDSDGDGIPDEIEAKLGSFFLSADSDGNGVSDLVEYRLTGKPCADPACRVAGRNAFAVCDGLKPTRNSSGAIQYPDSDKDGLNDCEEFLLKSDANNYNTNGNFIPDALGFKNSIPFLGGTAGAAWLSPLGDGNSSYQKLKLGQPIKATMAPTLNFQPRQISFEHESTTGDDLECYHLIADKVAVIGESNSIRISVVDNASVIDDKPTLRIVERQLRGYETYLYFGPGDFQ